MIITNFFLWMMLTNFLFTLLFIIVGFTLFMTALVLFVPINYAVLAEKAEKGEKVEKVEKNEKIEENSEKIEVFAKITWLFGIIAFIWQNNTINIKIAFYKKNISLDDFTIAEKPQKKRTITVRKKKSSKKKLNTKFLLTNLNIKAIILLGVNFARRTVKVIKPRKFKLNATIGLEDPCNTGQLLGFCEAFLWAAGLQNNVRLRADFAQPTLNFNLDLVGKFISFSFVRLTIWLILHSDFKKFTQTIRSAYD